MDAATLNTILIAACTGMAGFIVNGFLERFKKGESKADQTVSEQSDIKALVAALTAVLQERGGRAEKVEDRASAHGETLAGLSQRIAQIERMAHDCDELKSKVAVLEDWKDRNSSTWDQAITDIAAMKRDIKTLFEQMPDMVVARLIEKLGMKVRTHAAAGR